GVRGADGVGDRSRGGTAHLAELASKPSVKVPDAVANYASGNSGRWRAARTKGFSGKPRMISIVSLTIVFGTPVTRYLRLNSMNSVASIASAVMFGLAAAILCARTTALGQCGQVGVEKTWMCVGVS